jgi:hypothetical protein
MHMTLEAIIARNVRFGKLLPSRMPTTRIRYRPRLTLRDFQQPGKTVYNGSVRVEQEVSVIVDSSAEVMKTPGHDLRESHQDRNRAHAKMVWCYAPFLGLLLWLGWAGWRPVAVQAEGAMIRLSPELIETRVGQEVEVQFLIDNVTGLYGVDVRVTFDPGVLVVADADSTLDGIQVQPGQIPAPDFVAKNEADIPAGTIWYVAAQVKPRQPASGSGTLFTARFRAKMPGTSLIEISSASLADSDGVSMPVQLADGEVIVAALNGSTVVPQPTTNTRTPLPGSTPTLPGSSPSATLPATQAASQPSATSGAGSYPVPSTASTLPGSGSSSYPVPTVGTGTLTPTRAPATAALQPSLVPQRGTPSTAASARAPLATTGTPSAKATVTSAPQPSSGAARVAAAIPTAPLPPATAVPRAVPRPLISPRIFMLLVAVLAVLTILLALYLLRKVPESAS